ncbi:FixH family protein [Nocardia brasiliensis]|uniref:FixH family protein n=1 Tax=Nocardia brasiliensis TaxID=37326 RepID=UPI003789F840
MSETSTRTIRSRRPLIIAAALVVVLAVLGWLLWPSSAQAVALRSGTERHLVTVTLERVRLGDTAVDVAVTDRAGAPTAHATVTVQATQLLMGHAGPPVALTAAGDGRFHADSVSLMMTGPWELRLTIDAHGGVDQINVPLWVGN